MAEFNDEWFARANGGPIDTRRFRPDGPVVAVLPEQWEVAEPPFGHEDPVTMTRVAEARARVAEWQREVRYLQTLVGAPLEIQLIAEEQIRGLQALIVSKQRYIRLLSRT
jgi:hypothetical protein